MLISGINGLGAEVGAPLPQWAAPREAPLAREGGQNKILDRAACAAKNIILAGVHAVTVHDTAAVGLRDLSAHFYLSEADVGKNRAEASVAKLQDLNPAVAVSSATGPLTEALLAGFEVAVFTDIPAEEAARLDAFCRGHSPPIAFIKAETRGVFASVFCDFGPSFAVLDVDGEAPRQGIVTSIIPTGSGTSVVSCVDDERLEFQDGDVVVFSEVKGMEGINGKALKVKGCKAHSFEVEEDLSAYGAYKIGGMVVQEKQPKTLAFRPLSAAIASPGDFLLTDFAKMDRSPLLHLAFQARRASGGGGAGIPLGFTQNPPWLGAPARPRRTGCGRAAGAPGPRPRGADRRTAVRPYLPRPGAGPVPVRDGPPAGAGGQRGRRPHRRAGGQAQRRRRRGRQAGDPGREGAAAVCLGRVRGAQPHGRRLWRHRRSGGHQGLLGKIPPAVPGQPPRAGGFSAPVGFSARRRGSRRCGSRRRARPTCL